MSQQSQDLTQKSSQQTSDLTSAASSATQKTTETVSSAAANVGGALNFSGGLNAGTSSSSKTTTTESGGASKAQSDKLYEERIEDEYAKREGGA